MHILIVYGSVEGQARKIASFIAERIRSQSHQVTLQSSDDIDVNNFDINRFDAAIIGGPIHMGHYPKSLNKFVNAYVDWLNEKPAALFTVCMAVNSKIEKDRKRALLYGQHFSSTAGWKPFMGQTFAGAVAYTKYNLITRFIMKMITKRAGGSTDTSRDHEYTNWKAVDAFTDEYLRRLTNVTETSLV